MRRFEMRVIAVNNDFTSKAVKGQQPWTFAHLFTTHLYKASA
jgi:hypothetical protein